MDKELNELKSRFEEEIPTSFTARDKRAVMNRINEPEPERGSRHFFPKAMTAAVFAAVVLVGVMFANNQLGLTGGDGSAPVTQNSDKPTTEPEEKGELLLHITKERKNDSLTFDPETIKPGDVIGEDSPEVMKVTNVERSGNKTIITFDGTKEISGTLYNSEELQFIPNEESTQRLPVASEDLGDLVKAGLLNEDKV